MSREHFTGPGPGAGDDSHKADEIEEIEYEVEAGEIDLDAEELFDANGNRIDEAYLKRAIDDLHRQVGAGRPSLTGNATPSPRVSFRLRPEDRAALEARAKREHKKVSELAREAVERYLHAS